jgi:hypothetical protein
LGEGGGGIFACVETICMISLRGAVKDRFHHPILRGRFNDDWLKVSEDLTKILGSNKPDNPALDVDNPIGRKS